MVYPRKALTLEINNDVDLVELFFLQINIEDPRNFTDWENLNQIGIDP